MIALRKRGAREAMCARFRCRGSGRPLHCLPSFALGNALLLAQFRSDGSSAFADDRVALLIFSNGS